MVKLLMKNNKVFGLEWLELNIEFTTYCLVLDNLISVIYSISLEK